MPGGAGILPNKYGNEGVTILVRDPNWLFLFWETDRMDAHLELYGTDETGTTHYLIERFPVNDFGSRNVRVPVAGAYYVAKLVSPDTPPTESNVVMTPPADVSVDDLSSPAIEALYIGYKSSRSPASSHSVATLAQIGYPDI